MDVEWEISDFKWNSQNLIAERNDEKPSFIPVVDVPPAKGGSERRAEPVTPVCQVHGCGIAIEQPYYKASVQKVDCLCLGHFDRLWVLVASSKLLALHAFPNGLDMSSL